MQIDDMIHGTYDVMTVKRVYGDAIERDGATIIPVAAIRGGLGFGGGPGFGASGSTGGGGSGGGLIVRPVGVYRIENGTVTWEPALDVTRIALLGQVVAIVGLLVLRSIVRKRRR